jgi:hypothetical protein
MSQLKIRRRHGPRTIDRGFRPHATLAAPRSNRRRTYDRGMTGATYSFSTALWEWTAKASWYFVSVPPDDADDIEERFGATAAGFGSIRVEVTIGTTTWRTSIFPSKEERTYVLPVKKDVRRRENLEAGAVTDVDLMILEQNEQPSR